MWKNIAPDYEVSTDGQVRSWKSGEPKILTPQPDGNGYLCVDFRIDGKPKLYRIHRLVAETFIPNPQGKREVNHINGVKFANRVENLEWVTPSENQRHAYDTGLQLQGEDRSDAKLTNEQVVYIRDNPDHLTGRALAEMFGVAETTISDIQRGRKRKSAGGNVRGKIKSPVHDDVRNEIRRLYVRGSREFGTPALAKKFGVCQATVWRIVHED